MGLNKILPKILSLLLLVLLSPVFVYAQDEDQPRFVLDFQTTAEDGQFITVVEDSPVFFGDAGTMFTVTVVLQNAQNLCGVNMDLVFDPSVLRVVNIHEARGDLNYDGRSNIADVLVLGERFNEEVSSDNGYDYFDRDQSGNSNGVIDILDINAVLPYMNQRSLFWTSNSNTDFSIVRESVEIFPSAEMIEDTFLETGEGRINDMVVVLLPREHPENTFAPEGFGFDGDARIADITFEVIGGDSGTTTQLQIENQMAIVESTVVTTDAIEGELTPVAEPVLVNIP